LKEEPDPGKKLEPFHVPVNGALNGIMTNGSGSHEDEVLLHSLGEGGGTEWDGGGSLMEDEDGERDACAVGNEMVFSGGAWREAILKDLEEGKGSSTLYEKLSKYINCHLNFSESVSTSVDEAMAMTKQQRELLRYRKTQSFQSSLTRPRAGSRVLCLDGGGVRGLIQIEVLRQLELRTGAKVTEIFDWIVGTSTGGILALGLVYAKKELSELRQLYFKLRDRVFSAGRMGMGYNTESFEKVLKEEFGTEALMCDVSHPKVLITAVYKKTNQPELHFFNNCFDNEFSRYPVWKVARYTSAAPLFFTEMDSYVDGAVLANNPCEYALTAINNYFRGNREQVVYNVNRSADSQRDRVALVMSIGTGVFPAEDLGSTDAQQFLFFGKHWFKNKSGPFQTVENLITLLTKALMESESVAENCQSRLQSQGIPFYRFNPRLEEAMPSPDVSRERLLNMIMQTRYQTIGVHMDQLVNMLREIQTIMKRQRVQQMVSLACNRK
jgi:calcium-independent phospholipase A2